MTSVRFEILLAAVSPTERYREKRIYVLGKPIRISDAKAEKFANYYHNDIPLAACFQTDKGYQIVINHRAGILPKLQLEAVIAHELGHLAHRHMDKEWMDPTHKEFESDQYSFDKCKDIIGVLNTVLEGLDKHPELKTLMDSVQERKDRLIMNNS